MTIQMIPLENLTLSPLNARKTNADKGISELAASIEAEGLLQNLIVTEGKGGKYEVVAGGRRWRALKLLHQRKALDTRYTAACQIVDATEAHEISLTENEMRAAMHPADQFEAFKKLADEGHGDETIAAKFGVSPHTVKQRLKLANVSPTLMKIFRAGDLTLEQLMAFTVTDDHDEQERVWAEAGEYSRNPAAIRRALTEAQINGDDDRAVFVGIEAYEAAGGIVTRDLFSEDGDSYLADPALLDRLVKEKLECEAEIVRGEGWSWVEAYENLDWKERSQFEQIEGKELPLSKERKTEIAKLQAEQNALTEIEEAEGGITEEQSARYDELSRLIDAAETPEIEYSAKQKKKAGAIVTIGETLRGLVKKTDRKADDSDEDEDQESGEDTDRKVSAPKAEKSPFSAKLIEDLSAHRTAALQAELAGNPKTALIAVIHALAMSCFYGSSNSCLKVSGSRVYLQPSAGKEIEKSAALKKLDALNKAAAKSLPKDKAKLWDHLLEQDQKTLLSILAVCAGRTVDAVQRHGGKRDNHSDQLAETLALDMTVYWEATAASYFERVSRDEIIKAVKEGGTKTEADNAAAAKATKTQLAKAAEKALKGKGWLPAILRVGK